MLYLIRKSKLEKVFDLYISRFKFNKIKMGNHIFYELPRNKDKAVIRYDKGDPLLIVHRNFYEELRDFFYLDDFRTKELLSKWFRRQTGKKIKNILISDFPHQIKIYHGFG